MQGLPVILQHEATKPHVDQQKVGMKTGLEAAAITSFDTVVPGIWHWPATRRGMMLRGLVCGYDILISAIPTYEHYHPTG